MTPSAKRPPISSLLLLFLLSTAAILLGAAAAFLHHRASAASRSPSLAPRRDARAASLSAWGRTLGCPSLRDGVNLASPAAAAASAATAHRVRALERRADLGRWMQDLKFGGAGVELGVQAGAFAEILLDTWPNCSMLHLVDPWKQQSAYVDVANVDDRAQERLMAETGTRLARFKGRFRMVRALSYEAVEGFEDGSLDFVYVDAVHDYEGCLRDLCDWWPKLRAGGVLAGHDFLDGALPEGLFGVRSAVDRFATAVNRQVFVTQGWPEVDSREEWASFFMAK